MQFAYQRMFIIYQPAQFFLVMQKLIVKLQAQTIL